MRKLTVLPFIISIIILIAGCGQADFANVAINSSRVETDDAGNSYLVLSMDIENLTDSVLYIESASPTNEKGEKHLWFTIKDAEGNEYKATYYSQIESNILPMSMNPKTITTVEMAFEIPEDLAVAYLEVTQNMVGEKGSNAIQTQEIDLR